MSAIGKSLAKLKDRVLGVLRQAWYEEPVAVTTALAAGLVAAGAACHVVIGQSTAETIAGVLIPILLGGAVVRSQVRPGTRSIHVEQTRNRVIGHHRLRRKAREQMAEVLALQDLATSSNSALARKAEVELQALGVDAEDKLTIPRRRIGGWWVVEVVG